MELLLEGKAVSEIIKAKFEEKLNKLEKKPKIAVLTSNPDDSNIENPIEDTPDDTPEDQMEPEPETPKPENKESDNSTLKTIGVMAAVGAGVGAAAYAAHKVIDKKNSDDDHYSYVQVFQVL